MTDGFHVYENWTHDRARVHRGECPNCRWHPPLSDRDAAYRFAHSTGRSDIAGCGYCAP